MKWKSCDWKKRCWTRSLTWSGVMLIELIKWFYPYAPHLEHNQSELEYLIYELTCFTPWVDLVIAANILLRSACIRSTSTDLIQQNGFSCCNRLITWSSGIAAKYGVGTYCVPHSSFIAGSSWHVYHNRSWQKTFIVYIFTLLWVELMQLLLCCYKAVRTDRSLITVLSNWSQLITITTYTTWYSV